MLRGAWGRGGRARRDAFSALGGYAVWTYPVVVADNFGDVGLVRAAGGHAGRTIPEITSNDKRIRPNRVSSKGRKRVPPRSAPAPALTAENDRCGGWYMGPRWVSVQRARRCRGPAPRPGAARSAKYLMQIAVCQHRMSSLVPHLSAYRVGVLDVWRSYSWNL